MEKPVLSEPHIETSKKSELSRSIEKLNPQEFIDADGAERQIFTFKGKKGSPVKVVFYTREELPYNQEVIAGTKAVVLGGAPKHRDSKEWKQFLIDVQKDSKDGEYPLNPHNSKVNESVDKGESLFMVENTPVHLLDLAFYLGLEDKELREVRKQVAVNKTYPPKALDLLDDLIAGTVINEQGDIRKRQNQEGEAMTVLALLGDNDSREELDKRKAVIEKIDAKNTLYLKEYASKAFLRYSSEGYQPSTSAVATHVTKYKPEITPEGIKLKSSFHGSDETFTRNTVHFSLEGPISSAFGGAGGDTSWENMPYKIDGDLSQIRDTNGNPLMVNSVDTYFAVNPGQTLLIPNGHATVPGLLSEGKLREEVGNVTYYKSKDFTPKDLDVFFSKYYDSQTPDIKETYQAVFKKYLLSTIWSDLMPILPANEKATKQQMLQTSMDNVDINNLFDLLRQEPMNKVIDKTLDQIELVTPEVRARLTKKLEGWIAEKNRNGTMYDHFKMGSGGESNISDMMLGLSWGTKGSDRSQAHAEDGDAGSGLQNIAGRAFERVKEAEVNKKIWEARQAEAALHPDEMRLIGPWPEPVYYDYRQEKRVKIGDRKNVMAAFRENRMDLTQRKNNEGDPKLWPLQHRRMFYLAGVI